MWLKRSHYLDMARENKNVNVNDEAITLGEGFIISATIIPSTKNAVREDDEDIYADEEVIGEQDQSQQNDDLAEEFEDDY